MQLTRDDRIGAFRVVLACNSVISEQQPNHIYHLTGQDIGAAPEISVSVVWRYSSPHTAKIFSRVLSSPQSCP
ncbi:hypothetical protein SAMN00790413_05717 [Deinococcus hopiensis KR-140]|uniref:Uncharacterized protein n=1 Tax=Deinococcus hopiensis KR-140 TaxID=695939 RepID=A0A1W1UD94_9DEIO|nr:hypothetical protein SAMN00790413_05717 [Deinococcus hopiensis KR-140]